MISLKNIGVTFGNKTVFNHLSATINDGDFVVIVGPNGAGKSTLFEILAGRVAPTEGEIYLDGTNITHVHELQRALYISRLFQDTYLGCVPHMTVAQNLSIATYKSRSASFRNGMHTFPDHLIKDVLAPLGFDNPLLLNTPMEQLSGGQRQIISLIMATIIKPRILLLDEPTAALDPISATKLLTFAHNFIKTHRITTLMITHDPELARTMGNRLWVIENGLIAQEYDSTTKKDLPAHLMSGNIDYAAIKNA